MKVILVILFLCSVASPQSSGYPRGTIIRGVLLNDGGTAVLASPVTFTLKPGDLREFTVRCATDKRGLIHGEHGGNCVVPGNDILVDRLKAYTWWEVSAKGLNQKWFIRGNVLDPQALAPSHNPLNRTGKR